MLKLTITDDGIKLEPYSFKLHVGITLIMTSGLTFMTVGMVTVLEILTK